eukprot:gene14230-18848_t
MAAAAVIFFAFYGFDAISTAAEEARNPGRDLTIAIVGSMLACAAIYMLVAAAALGAMPFDVFAKSPEPLAFILREQGFPQVAVLIAAAAVIALPTVIMAFMFGQSRYCFTIRNCPPFRSTIATSGGGAREGQERLRALRRLSTGVTGRPVGRAQQFDELARMAHAVGALVLFDGCQAVVHQAVNVKAIDADFYVFSGHKLYGPTGIGILY